MRISDLELLLVEVPRTAPEPPFRSLVVRLATDLGVEGWGEGHVAWRPAELPARRSALLPILSGRSVFQLEELSALEALSPGGLRSAIEIAAADAVGQLCRQPLSHLWGGPYRPRIPLAARLPAEPADRIPHRARELAEQGFHTQILASTGRVETDVAAVAAVRDAGGERLELRLDAAGKYGFDEARQLAMALARGRVQYLLDPLAGGEVEPLARLSHAANAPLAAATGIEGPQSVFALARAGAIGHVVVSLDQVGGLTAARKCGHVAEAAGLGAALDAGTSLGIGTAAMLHLAASAPGFASANESAYFQLADDLLAEPLAVIDGQLAVPDGPGLGIRISRAKLDRYQIG